jgi:hypothetical protein
VHHHHARRAADLQQKLNEVQAQLTEVGVEKDAALAGQAAAQTSLAESTVSGCVCVGGGERS